MHAQVANALSPPLHRRSASKLGRAGGSTEPFRWWSQPCRRWQKCRSSLGITMADMDDVVSRGLELITRPPCLRIVGLLLLAAAAAPPDMPAAAGGARGGIEVQPGMIAGRQGGSRKGSWLRSLDARWLFFLHPFRSHICWGAALGSGSSGHIACRLGRGASVGWPPPPSPRLAHRALQARPAAAPWLPGGLPGSRRRPGGRAGRPPSEWRPRTPLLLLRRRRRLCSATAPPGAPSCQNAGQPRCGRCR